MCVRERDREGGWKRERENSHDSVHSIVTRVYIYTYIHIYIYIYIQREREREKKLSIVDGVCRLSIVNN